MGVDGDYLGEESGCVEQLIDQVLCWILQRLLSNSSMQTLAEEVLDQAELFSDILSVDMLEWSVMLAGEGEENIETLVTKTEEINEK